jgi:hypothetical protein
LRLNETRYYESRNTFRIMSKRALLSRLL